ncbi:acylphosphatase [Tropicimonas marinistellae]|uniref:acylphosphatase n=1 Tax=Tropicimonas marinistellae TaxID=1739787 RepID=UPI000831E9C9|nr:acylphosphatase [Tropicimonas marinistellae]
MESTVVKLRIHGRVQAVGYRAWCQAAASHHGVDGWVSNEADGTVSAVLSGASDSVSEMIRAIEHGPPGAHVTAVEREDLSDAPPPGFRIVF